MELGTVCEQWGEGPVVGISILNKLVLPISVDDFDTMELNLVSNSDEHFVSGLLEDLSILQYHRLSTNIARFWLKT